VSLVLFQCDIAGFSEPFSGAATINREETMFPNIRILLETIFFKGPGINKREA